MMLRTIHHFEDEPELLTWIPGALLNRYWLDHPGWIVDDGGYEETAGDFLIRFRLQSVEPATIEYRVYRTKDEFEATFFDCARAGDVVLLDVMVVSQEDGGMMPAGLSLYEMAKEVVGEGNVFFLTAFPQQFFGDATFEKLVIAKPPDADALISLITSILRIE